MDLSSFGPWSADNRLLNVITIDKYLLHSGLNIYTSNSTLPRVNDQFNKPMSPGTLNKWTFPPWSFILVLDWRILKRWYIVEFRSFIIGFK